MPDFLDPELTTIALCWRTARGDGVALGFTTHDRDLVRGGIVYRAAPGIAPSAVSLSDGFEVDTLDIAGALSDAAITADDLAMGRWDGAQVKLFAIDWAYPEGDAVPLARGELGEVAQADQGFTAELRGPTALLERAVVETTSPDCRAELGDRRCRVDLAGRARRVLVVAVDPDGTLRLDAVEPSADAFGGGRLRWIDGPRSGIGEAILISAGDGLVLRDPVAVEVGWRAEIVEGCDRLFATCCDRFGNAINFRGEPHLPGNDLLTRYPS